MNLIHPKDLERNIIDLKDKNIIIKFPTNSEFINFCEELEELFFTPNTKLNDDFELGVHQTFGAILIIPKNETNINRIKELYKKFKAEKNIKIEWSNIYSEKFPFFCNIDIEGTLTKRRNPIDSKLRHEVFKRDNYKCVECGATSKDSILHVDHKTPVSQGGSDELENLRT